MLDLNAQGDRVDLDQAAEATRQACTALEQLQKDEVFQNDLKRWGAANLEEQRIALLRDFRTFADSFLVPESRILSDAGLNAGSVNRILGEAVAVQASLRSKVAADQIVKNIDQLRQGVCSAAMQIAATRNRDQTGHILIKVGLGLAGAAILIADVPIAPVTPVSVMSGAVGGILMGRAIEDLLLPR